MKMQKCVPCAHERNAMERQNALRSADGNCRRRENSRYDEDIPFLASLPGRGECLAAAGFGAMWVTIALAPIWWNYDGAAVLGAMAVGTVLAYAAMRAAVQIKWHLHCRACRPKKAAKKCGAAPVREVCGSRRPHAVQYVTNEVLQRGWRG